MGYAFFFLLIVVGGEAYQNHSLEAKVEKLEEGISSRKPFKFKDSTFYCRKKRSVKIGD